MKIKIALIAAISLPLLGFLAMVLESEMGLSYGKTFTYPISGYDPRDLLKGHYVRYDFNWDFDLEKTTAYINANIKEKYHYKKDACLCIFDDSKAKIFPVVCDSWGGSELCAGVVKGQIYVQDRDRFLKYSKSATALLSQNVRFELGIEKYYVSEVQVEELEKILRDRKDVSIKFKVNHQRRAVLLDLFVGDKPWRDYIQNNSFF